MIGGLLSGARLLSCGAAAILLVAAPLSRVAGQPSIRLTVAGPAGDTIRSATPEFVLRTAGVVAGDRPLTLVIEVSDRSDFAGRAIYSETVQGSDSAHFFPAHLFPQRSSLFWRGRVRTATGVEVLSDVAGPRQSATWLRLISPAPGAGVIVRTRRPQFIWHSAAISSPPGPWAYKLIIDNVGGGRSYSFDALRDTMFTMPFDLDVNASYRWAVTATVATGEEATATSSSTFVIVSDAAPSVTLLYQNFPNPFPSATSSVTCFWFDLHEDSTVTLDILDLRGIPVRTILPSAELTGILTAGRYGRASAGSGSGCDPRFTWDGRDRENRFVPQGVYLVRLKTSGTETFKKVLFRGR